MSDFLSKFSGDRYQQLLEEEDAEKSNGRQVKPVSTNYVNASKPKPTPSPKQHVTPQKHRSQPVIPNVPPSNRTTRQTTDDSDQQPFDSKKEPAGQSTDQRDANSIKGKSKRRDDFYEETEFDPSYQKRKRKKQLLIGSSLLLLIIGGFFLFYRLTHVSLPDFTNKPIAELREWGQKNNIEFSIEQSYDLNHEVNTVISQNIAPGSMVSKGSTVAVSVSLGADPNEVLGLPDFSKMRYSDAQAWITEHKAENLKLQQQFSDTVAEGNFIKLDLPANVHAADYKRGDKATVYYSRGAETVEKNIDVPDFATKTKADVEAWARSNNVTVTYIDKANSSVATGIVINQSISAGTKISKKDPFEVTISAGKGTVVPDFNYVTIEAASTVSGLTVLVRQEYSNSIPYGKLISQSQPAGTELTEKDDRNVVVIYSAGTPYLRDLRGKNEGDLQKYFYDEFRSKGAEVYYTTYYVDSSSPRGVVVEQSAFETEITTHYTVRLGISNGSLYSGVPTPPSDSDSSSSSQLQTYPLTNE